MSLLLNGTDGVTYNDGTLQSSAPVGRNRIINGNMQIAQRGTSAAGVTNDYATCDRFLIRNNNAGLYTITQDTDAPDGFGNSLKWDCTTADASPAAGDFAILQYRTEGQDLQQLAFGTPSAQQFTVSFWVKSSETGTAVLRIAATNSGNVMQGHTYTISSANTWEKKTITFTANTSDVIPNDNLIGFNLYWYLATGTDRTSGTLPTTTWEAYLTANEAVGQTINIASSIGSYFNITGVQLEVGTTATDFENLQYGTQLQLCQRYYQKSYDITTAVPTNTAAPGLVGFPSVGNTVIPNSHRLGMIWIKTSMRASPTVSIYSYTSSTPSVVSNGIGTDLAANSGRVEWQGDNSFVVYNGSGTTITPSNGAVICHYSASSEL